MSLIKIKQSASNPTAPVLFLLHGLASDERDLIGMAPQLNLDLEIVSLRAPHMTGYSGYSWFDIEFLPDGSRKIDSEQAVESRNLVTQEIEAYAGRKIVIAGFSQGAMVACGVALDQPNLVSAAWLMSGRWIPAWGRDSYWGHLPFLVQHGREDAVLNIAEGRELAGKLREAGQEVTWREYAMGHQVSIESLRDATSWLRTQCY